MMQANRTEKYQQLRAMLNEKQWRHYLALEAQERGSVAQVSQEARVSQNTIRRGLRELEAGVRYTVGERQREEGGGRKHVVEKDVSLLADLESLLEPKGDPMSLLKWTTKSVVHLKEALEQMGHVVAETTIRRLLHAQGYSLRANKKNIEGTSHPDRDAQFVHIATKCKTFEQQGNPIISIDCKKKGLLGNFKNNGAEWQAKGEETAVNVYDFLSIADGKAIPYGVYDLVHNQGFVNVGIDHDTAAFAVESIRRWWQQSGKSLYPGKNELLLTADGGGSNGAGCVIVGDFLWLCALREPIATTANCCFQPLMLRALFVQNQPLLSRRTCAWTQPTIMIPSMASCMSVATNRMCDSTRSTINGISLLRIKQTAWKQANSLADGSSNGCSLG